MASVLAVVLLLGLLLLGLLQARANTLEPAFLRYQVWELLVGLVVLAAAALYGSLPHPSGMIVKVVPVLLLVLLAVVLLVRKRRADASADPDF